ncbi:M1 family aminopeptidase [Spirosoma daeguense]
MFIQLLAFEWRFIYRKLAFYVLLTGFLVLGGLMGTAARFPFPNTYQNGTYVLNYVIGLTSLLAIFSTTLLAAQTLFREKDAQFDAILYATPLRKMPYVLSRFAIIFAVSTIGYFLFSSGLLAGHLLKATHSEEFGAFNLINYLNPFFLLLLPNILLCTAVACCIGLVANNKLLVYVAGVFLYFLYWGVSFFTNSPLIANSTPVSVDSMRWAALLDPFGLAAFFEQTYYWTTIQRNNQLLQPGGSLLLNRLLYGVLSISLLAIAYRKFSFSTNESGRKRATQQIDKPDIDERVYQPVQPYFTRLGYPLRCLWNLVSIDFRLVITGIPLWIVCLGWVGFLSIETLSDIGGNTRLPEQFATTGIMIDGILTGLPLIVLMVLVFFGNELYWNSRTYQVDGLEKTTAVDSGIWLVAKWLSLLPIILILIVSSIVMCVGIQFLKGYVWIDWQLYAQLFYLIGFPLALNAGLIICLQALVQNRYVGIALAGIVVLATNTSAGGLLRLRHPLVKFANTFQGDYSEMAGFGRTLVGFDYQMVYWFCVTVILFLLAVWFSNRATSPRFSLRSGRTVVLVVALLGASCTGYTIFSETDTRSREDIADWQQQYETTYAFLKNKPQPTITAVETTIDLFPSEVRYQVNGQYTLVNRSAAAIDTLYIYGDNEMNWGNWTLPNGKLVHTDNSIGYYVFRLNHPLQMGDSTRISFQFGYSGSPFRKAASFNTILKNGTFIRISKYFPRLGYVVDNEIENERERKKRKLPPANNLLALQAPRRNTVDFIRFDAIVSTDTNQTAISIGELKKQWTKFNRAYYHYVNPSPMPFRFAVASARYAVKTIKHGPITVEAYFHPQHGQNIERLIKTATSTLDYCQSQFGKYPYQTVRFAEISAFTKGFAGTAYPGSLFINESFGYQRKLDNQPERDILTEMVSHELSHNWWGNSKIAPDYREGSLLLTETLAMYTELMIHKKTYGEKYLPDRVNVHKEIYLSNRSSADEEPLYRLNPAKAYLAYDKGMVVMYQIYKLLGEEKINRALQRFYVKFAYPGPPPISCDLLAELHAVASPSESVKIDELFTQITTYAIRIDKTNVVKRVDGTYALDLQATIDKYIEDGKGNFNLKPVDELVDVAIKFSDNSAQRVRIRLEGNNIHEILTYPLKPVTITIDPDGKLLTRTDESKERRISE